jgi:hypothetical protein
LNERSQKESQGGFREIQVAFNYGEYVVREVDYLVNHD